MEAVRSLWRGAILTSTILALLTAGFVRAQTARIVGGDPIITWPGTDSNSPSHWEGNTFVQFNSYFSPHAIKRSTGAWTDSFGAGTNVSLLPAPLDGESWLEATAVIGGVVYGIYHNEVPTCGKVAPQIGLVRWNAGLGQWDNLGIILTSGYAGNCSSSNRFFVGGVGDPSISLYPNETSPRWLDIYFGEYGGPDSAQGVSTAHIDVTLLPSLTATNGNINVAQKFNGSGWTSAGVGGPSTPIFNANNSDTTRPNCADPAWNGFWGPSVHYNAYLGKLVMLLNKSVDAEWNNNGIWISYLNDRIRPSESSAGWSRPLQLSTTLTGMTWYPQVVGDPDDPQYPAGSKGTDKMAGRDARLFVNGVSNSHIHFDTTALSFVTNVTPGTLRSDFTGLVGIRFTMNSTVTPTSVGWYCTRVEGAHTLQFYTDSGSTLGEPVTVFCSTAGFQYAAISGVTLSAGTTYSLLGSVVENSTSFYNADVVVTTTSVAMAQGYAYSCSPWCGFFIGGPNPFGPATFTYVAVWCGLEEGAPADTSGCSGPLSGPDEETCSRCDRGSSARPTTRQDWSVRHPPAC